MARDVEWVTHSHKVVAGIERLLGIVGHDGASVRGYVITGDEDFLRGHPEALSDMEAAWEKLGGLLADNPQQEKRLAALAPLIAERLALTRTYVDLRKSGGVEALQGRVRRGEKTLDEIFRIAAEMTAHEAALLKGREMTSRASARITEEVIVLASVLAFALVGGALWLLARELDSRRKGEQALRESEERLRRAADAAELGIWMWEPAGDRIVWENEWPYEILGVARTAEPVTAARFAAEFIHPDDVAAFEQAVGATVQDGARLFYQGRFRRPDGGQRWVQLTGKPEPGPDGSCLRVLGTVQDITAPKQAETTLRQNAGLFATLVEQAPGGVYVVDAQFRLQQVNAQAQPVFASVRPLIGRDFAEVMEIVWGPEIGAQCTAIFRHTLETGEPYISPRFAEQRHDIGVEEAYEWETKRVTLPDGQHGVVCYFFEVSERARAAEALRVSEERWRYALEVSELGAWELNLADHTAWRSLRHDRIFGYAELLPEWTFEMARQHILEEDRPLVDGSFERAMAEHTDWSFEARIRRADGAVRWIWAYGKSINDADGHPIRMFGLISDITGRKQAEEALRVSEGFNRSIIESSPDCIKVLDLEGNLLSMVSGMELLGITDLAPLLGKPWIELWEGADDRAAADAAVATAAAGAEGHFAGFFRTLRGEDKWWDVVVTPILGTDGQPSRLLAVSRDVTQRQQAEEVLRQSAAQFETLVNEAPLGVLLIDADFRIRQVNPTALPAYGNIPDLLGRDYAEILHILWPKAQADAAVKQFRHTLETGEPCFVPEMIEKRADRQTTEYYEWQINRIPLPDGRPGVVCYFRDISERVLAQQEIRESEERYRSLFNSMDEGFCIIELIFDESQQPVDWRYLEVNPSFETLTGIHDILGKRIRDLVPDHEEYWFEIYGKVVLTGEPVRFVNEAKGLDRWFDLYAFRVGGAGSLKVAVLFTNITERKRAEAEILSLNQELESRVAERTAELRTVVYTLEAEMAERRRLEEEILGVGERAQARIGQDLHDDLGQQLAGLAMLAQLLSDQLSAESHPKAADAARLKTFLTESISTTRNLAKSLYPVELERGGLMLALYDLAHRTELRAGMVCTVREDAAFRFEKAAEIHLYRIVQESIGNALKHGNARHIAIGCTAREGASTLTVTDDGSGFERPKEGKWAGMGLHLFQYRARLIGAAVTVARGEHGGCQVSCSMGISKATQTRALRGDSTRASLPS